MEVGGEDKTVSNILKSEVDFQLGLSKAGETSSRAAQEFNPEKIQLTCNRQTPLKDGLI